MLVFSITTLILLSTGVLSTTLKNSPNNQDEDKVLTYTKSVPEWVWPNYVHHRSMWASHIRANGNNDFPSHYVASKPEVNIPVDLHMWTSAV